MLLVSYGEVIPMLLTRKYTPQDLVDGCEKRKRRYEALVGGRPLPPHVFVRHSDGQREAVPADRIMSTCDAVARYHDRLRGDP